MCKEWRTAAGFHRAASSPDGLFSNCKACVKIKSIERRDYLLEQARRRKYGISPEDQRLMLVAQKGLCKSCGDPFPSRKETHLDHDHVTGRARAYLCGACNHIIGRANDDIDHLVACAEYLIEQKAIPLPVSAAGEGA